MEHSHARSSESGASTTAANGAAKGGVWRLVALIAMTAPWLAVLIYVEQWFGAPIEPRVFWPALLLWCVLAVPFFVRPQNRRLAIAAAVLLVVLLTLHLMPLTPQGAFWRRAARVVPGMTRADVGRVMDGYPSFPMPPGQTHAPSISWLGYRPRMELHSYLWLAVSYKDDRAHFAHMMD